MDTPKAYLERIENGRLIGWAFDPSSSPSAQVSVIAEGISYGLAEANLPRPDVVKAGLSSETHCGFSMPLDKAITAANTSAIFLQINDKRIPTPKLKDLLEKSSGNFWGHLVSVSLNGIVVEVISETCERSKLIQIRIDEEFDYAFAHTFSKGRNELSIPIDLKFFDSSNHIITVGVEHHPFSLFTEVVILSKNTTPWIYIQESFKEIGYTSLSLRSKFRYESLTKQLSAISEKKLPGIEISDLNQAHEQVVIGWENRREFPKLKLPDFRDPIASIIVFADESISRIYHTIASIALAHNLTAYEVILISNSSLEADSTLLDIFENLHVIHYNEPLNVAMRFNLAAQRAQGKYIIYLDGDIEVSSCWIDELIAPFENDSVAMTGSKILNKDGSLRAAGGILLGSGNIKPFGDQQNPYHPMFNYIRETDYLPAESLCIRSEVWQTLGGFDPEYPTGDFVDVDLALRARGAGYKTVFAPLSTVSKFNAHTPDQSAPAKNLNLPSQSRFKTKWHHTYKKHNREKIDDNLEKDRNIDYRVLVIDSNTPNAKTNAGGYAAVEEMKLLISLGFKVTFVPENMANLGKLTVALQRLGIEALYSPFYTSVFDVIEQRIPEFDVVYITRYSVAEKYIGLIREKSTAKLIFNNADLHFLRQLRAANNSGEYTKEYAMETRDKELEVMKQVDVILSYNETEHAVIQSHIDRANKIFTCPWVLHPKTTGKSFEKRDGIAFIGSFSHHPNATAVKYFVNHIFPKLSKANSAIKFYIYGSNPTEEILELNSEQVIVKGFVENLDEIYHNHKALVSPLLSGAGIKGKVLEGISYGCPQVMTKIASEATGLTHKISAWVTDDPEEMVEGILELYSNKSLWERFAENSGILASERYSSQMATRMMVKILNFIDIYVDELHSD